MAYYNCIYNNDDIIGIGDNFNVSLTGSHNKTTTATVCYIYKGDKTLLGDISLGNANLSTACAYAWNYVININNKKYTGTCRIPTLEQITSKCAGYKRSFDYWLSTYSNASNYWYVYKSGSVNPVNTVSFVNASTLPFIEITL